MYLTVNYTTDKLHSLYYSLSVTILYIRFSIVLFLKAEASREMYRAVMTQVVSFLERAHRSLDLLSEKQRVVQRTRSEYHVAGAGTSSTPTHNGSINETPEPDCGPQVATDGYTAFRDFTWYAEQNLTLASSRVYSCSLLKSMF